MSTPELLKNASERAISYLEGLPARPVPPSPAAIAQLEKLVSALPEGPTAPERVLELLDQIGSPATTATAGGRFFGFVIGGSLPPALAANWLAGAWDQNAGSSFISPISGKLEEVAQSW